LKTVTALKRNGVILPAPEVTVYTYTAVGSRSTQTLPNGIVTTYLYDTLNRLTNLTHKAFGTNLLASYSYQLHSTGRRTNAVEIIHAPDADGGGFITNTVNWFYDAMYRLTNEVSSSSLSTNQFSTEYRYDKVGNRVKKLRHVGGNTETTSSFFNDNDQLLREEINALDGTLSTNYHGYDLNGSLVGTTNGGATITYTYNLANKLSTTTAGGLITRFQYNDSGIRVSSSTTGTAPTYFLVDLNNHTGFAQILEEMHAPGGTPSMSYLIGDDVLGQSNSSITSHLLYDGHGSTRQLASADGSANIAKQWSYDAYGSVLGALSSPPETSLLYCGEHFDSDLHMYNLRARFYDPANGRFTARDSFRGNSDDPQTLHKYAYAACDPANGIDPSGQFTLVELMTVTAFVVILALASISLFKSIRTGFFPAQLISPENVPVFHKQLARLCDDVYNAEPHGLPGWQVATAQDLAALGLQNAVFKKRSFFAQLYHSSHSYVLAFRGTDDNGDWYSNIGQSAFGPLLPTQYGEAKELAAQVNQAVGGADLTITGHSLGGGLAGAAALETDRPAVTFNAAGLSLLTTDGYSYSSSTVNYSVQGEILSSLQNHSFASTAFGKSYRLNPFVADATASPTKLHSMYAVLRALYLF
jgi:RHS repeat-associated protein